MPKAKTKTAKKASSTAKKTRSSKTSKVKAAVKKKTTMKKTAKTAKATAKKTGAAKSPKTKKSAAVASSEQYLYFFGGGKAEGTGEMKDVLGGKGAGLAQMTNAGLNVPPGFTISTSVCALFYENNLRVPREIRGQIKEYMQRLEQLTGRTFGDPENPLLVSVRSGAKFSMPGMMDTILNLGLNDQTIKGIIALTDNERSKRIRRF